MQLEAAAVVVLPLVQVHVKRPSVRILKPHFAPRRPPSKLQHLPLGFVLGCVLTASPLLSFFCVTVYRVLVHPFVQHEGHRLVLPLGWRGTQRSVTGALPLGRGSNRVWGGTRGGRLHDKNLAATFNVLIVINTVPYTSGVMAVVVHILYLQRAFWAKTPVLSTWLVYPWCSLSGGGLPP